MRNVNFRRVIAFLIDLFIVSVITSMIASIPFLNPEKKHYEEVYHEVIEAFEKYQNEELSLEDYESEFLSLSYDLNRLNLNYTIINIVVILAYFGIFQWQRKGKTIGKQFMKLQVVSVKKEKDVSIISYILRCTILNNLIITIVQLIVIFTMNKENFYPIYNNLNLVGYVLLYIIIFFVLIRTDKRGLHDFVAGTKVISLLDEKEAEVVKEAIYEEIEKKDETTKKSTQSKK